MFFDVHCALHPAVKPRVAASNGINRYNNSHGKCFCEIILCGAISWRVPFAVLFFRIFENITPGIVKATITFKMQGSWNLHELVPHNFDHFVMLSSATCAIVSSWRS